MKLTAKVKLDTDKKDFEALKQTLILANKACDDISAAAWGARVFSQFGIHKLTYYDIREAYPDLSSQIVIRCIAKVADAYKLDKKVQRTFQPLGSIAYDLRILRWYTEERRVSIWAIGGRLKHLPYKGGERQYELLKTQQGESNLCLIDGAFYLFATCEIDEPTPADVEDVLGVDFGIKNIAVDSDGNRHSGAHVSSLRKRRRRQRKRLQSKGTHAAKRRLKKISGKEQRFAKHTNHVISKQIVNIAKRTDRAIALEDLKGIRGRVRLRRNQRDDLHSWAFHDLGQKILYKAKAAGVPVVIVNPKYTSQACSVCGCIEKRNRPNQETFLCVSCGFAANADANAAVNISIRGRGAISRPHFPDATTTLSASSG